ncbi:MAG: pyrimidine dimer DNA glycosylase/endonuclease V [Candidatus Korarchaeum sp.]|nr:pyrimidine dimer DNA glycosylase/endonuclease V [Candidatus Korarchaeum sp.]MDW8035139.1 pyrimidine dimer DNA glycosylase/endonuclease V [Candidatus Korarchaeum sp.]
MRLWSIHPSYLDRLGLLGLWREGLLAKAVIEGRAAGYRRHPQLRRFLEHEDPQLAINSFLYFVLVEGEARGYRFDCSKVSLELVAERIMPVTSGQLAFEFKHLLGKLERRDLERYLLLRRMSERSIECNPVFYIVEGDVESFERIALDHG